MYVRQGAAQPRAAGGGSHAILLAAGGRWCAFAHRALRVIVVVIEARQESSRALRHVRSTRRHDKRRVAPLAPVPGQ